MRSALYFTSGRYFSTSRLRSSVVGRSRYSCQTAWMSVSIWVTSQILPDEQQAVVRVSRPHAYSVSQIGGVPLRALSQS